MGIESRLDTPFAEAVRRAGGQSAFGRIVGRAQQTIYDRLKSGLPLWDVDVLKVEAVTKVSRHALRPDLYPDESAAGTAALDHAAAVPAQVRP